MKHLTLLGLVSAFLCLAAAALAAPVPSFIYDGQPADLYIYNRSSEGDQNTDEFFSVIDRFTTPDGRLQVEMYRKHYKRFPVVEYSVTLKNLSDDQPTAIIENFKSYDGTVELPAFGQSVELNIIRGSVCAPEDFAREFSTLAKGESRAFRTPSGRSSNDCMPFLETSFDAYNGLIVAVGWTGAWAADIENTGDALHITAGMDKTRFYLKPGETIRQPSITLFTREGIGRRAFKTVVHRFMLDCKVPRRADGTLHQPILPITAGGGNKTPEMMLDIINYALENKIPFDTFWIDAGWYGPARQLDPLPNCSTDWYQYVGDWTFNTTTNPAGNFRKISDAVHRANMRFLVWFEPERVAEAPIRQEHPEYIHDNLLDYGQDAALEWIQNAVYSVIEDSKIDIYRQDFNMEPGPVWAKMDESDPDRVGIAEARHVAGLYKFLDDMRARFPDIMQENCASGGRRIDIEMISRAFSYCRSDYPIGPKPGDTAFVMSQNATLNTTPYLPFQGSETDCVSIHDDYAMASCFAAGTVFTPTDFDGAIVARPFTDQETVWFQKAFGLAKRIKDLSTEDFYPLVDETTAGDDCWAAWQFFGADAGCAIAFRRPAAAENDKIFELTGIDPEAQYDVELFDGTFDAINKSASGKELAAWKVSIPKRSFQLIFYKKK
ncbi:MAG: alpha-galactosidase [Thermoguttaceae bacterium]|nr:alpha-galactosidase [Thermoguttaceae bacterium]